MRNTEIKNRKRDPIILTWIRFVRVIKKTGQYMDRSFAEFNLNRYQFDLLMQVNSNPGINQKTCAERLNVSKGNITQHLDTLGNAGLIERNKLGRESSLQLTQKGLNLIDKLLPVHDTHVDRVLSVLSAEEISQFQSILRKLDRSLD